jgi:hypothetical protein
MLLSTRQKENTKRPLSEQPEKQNRYDGNHFELLMMHHRVFFDFLVPGSLSRTVRITFEQQLSCARGGIVSYNCRYLER